MNRLACLPSRRPSPRSPNTVAVGLSGMALALLLALGLPAVQAAPSSAARVEFPLLAQANGVSLDQAVAQVQRRTGGRILSAETHMDNGTPVHHIRVLTNNKRVRTIRVDGRSGEWR